MSQPYVVQRNGHRVVLTRTDSGVVVRHSVMGREVSRETIDNVPFHVLLDRACGWVRDATPPVPADLAKL